MLLSQYHGEYSKTIQDGMAWGMTTQSDGKFWPILFIKNFQMAAKNSGSFSGQLVLNYCDLLLGNGSLTAGDIKLKIDDIANGICFIDTQNNNMLLSIYPDGVFGTAAVKMLNGIISFFTNEAGSKSLKIGTGSNPCVLTDEGYFSCADISASNHIYTAGYIHAVGTVTGSNISSDKKLKKNIKDSKTKAIDIIKQIKHRTFDWKKDNRHIDIGYIAQELEKVDKNFTFKQDDTYYVDFLNILATSTKAIQEQQDIIENLQKKDKEKDELIKDLYKRLEKLEVQNGKN